MVKLITTIIVALVAQLSFGQTTMFDKFDGKDEINTVVVSKKMFEMIGNLKVNSSDKDLVQYHALAKKLDNLKIFMTSNSKYASELKSTADKYLKSANLEELMRVSDGGKNVKIYVKTGANESVLKEMFMIIEGASKDHEMVIMSLTGEFNLTELSALTEKMNLPGGEEIKKASKGKK